MTPRPRPRWSARRRALSTITAFAVLTGLGLVNRPMLAAAEERYNDYEISRPEYKAQNGSWAFLDVPREFKVNAIHAALLPTGKVLIIAGSGNRLDNFKAGSFKSIVWDPA